MLRWKSEYLSALRKKDKNLVRNSQNEIKVGKIVLINDDCPQQFWRMVIISNLHERVKLASVITAADKIKLHYI